MVGCSRIGRSSGGAPVQAKCGTVGPMRDEVEAVLIGLGAFAILSIVVPRVNARQGDPRSGRDRLFDSPRGQAYVVVLLLVLVVSIAIAAASK